MLFHSTAALTLLPASKDFTAALILQQDASTRTPQVAEATFCPARIAHIPRLCPLLLQHYLGNDTPSVQKYLVVFAAQLNLEALLSVRLANLAGLLFALVLLSIFIVIVSLKVVEVLFG